MHENSEHLFAQKTKRQNNLLLPLLGLALQIVFNVNFSNPIFAMNKNPSQNIFEFFRSFLEAL